MAFLDLNRNDQTDWWEWLVLFLGLNYLAQKRRQNPENHAPSVTNVQAARRSLVWGVVLSPLLVVPALFIHVSTIPDLTDEAYQDFWQTYENERARSDAWVDEREIVAQVRADHGLEGFPIGAGVLLLAVPYAWWRLRRSRKLRTRPIVDPWFHHHGDALAHSHPHDGVHTHGPDGSILPPHPQTPGQQPAQTYIDNRSFHIHYHSSASPTAHHHAGVWHDHPWGPGPDVDHTHFPDGTPVAHTPALRRAWSDRELEA